MIKYIQNYKAARRACQHHTFTHETATRSLPILLGSLLLCSLCITLTVTDTHADDLRDVANSNAFEKLEYLTNRETGKQYGKNWSQLGQNYSQLFLDKKGVELLHRWLGTPKKEFKLVHETAHPNYEYIQAGRTYETRSKNRVFVVVLVPHPRHAEKVEFGLIKAFSNLEPPYLDADSVEELQIQGHPGQFYTTKQNGCSLNIKLSKSSVVNIAGNCTASEEIVELAQMLTIDRLDTKLNS